MIKHTPGPWKVTKDARVFSESAREWNRTFNANTPAFIAACSENAANARLIAAAPDLLAAAEDMDAWTQRDVPGALSPSEWLLGGCVNDFAASLAKLRAALAAAKGEE